MVNVITEYSKAAKSHLADDDHRRATELYIRSAGYRLGEYFGNHDTDESNRDLLLSDLLFATGTAKVGGLHDLARHVATLCAGISPLISHHSKFPEIEGLCHEVVGDCYFVCGDSRAIEEYEHAKRVYMKGTQSDWLPWGMEPEFEMAFDAYCEYVDSAERSDELALDHELRYDPVGRIELKMDAMGGRSV